MPVFVVAVLLLNGNGDEGGAADPTSSGPRAELPALDVDTPEITPEADAACPSLIGGLPILLGELTARPVRSPGPYAVAWGDPAVVLRCGVPRPDGYGPASALLEIQGVVWFSAEGTDSTLWTAVDRSVFVDVLVPSAQSSAALTMISTVIAQRLPEFDAGAPATPTG